MMARIFAVRVCTHTTNKIDQRFVDSMAFSAMRDAGIVQVHREDTDGMCFDIMPPQGRDSNQWANETAVMLSGQYGLNAVAAPAWNQPEAPAPALSSHHNEYTGG